MRHTLGGALIAPLCASLSLLGACTSLTSEVQSNNCTQVGSLVVGDTVRDSVTASSCRQSDQTYSNRYRFQLTAQTKLRASLSSPLHKAFLFVSDSQGVVIANSSITSPLDTAATLYLILRAGSYALGVSSVATAPSGPLRMVALTDTTAISGCLPVWISPGITTSQTISTASCTTGPLGSNYPSHSYLTVTLAGRELKLTEHATAFAPQIVSRTRAARRWPHPRWTTRAPTPWWISSRDRMPPCSCGWAAPTSSASGRTRSRSTDGRSKDMEVHVNYLAVLVAAIANYVIATIWYAGLFGGLWKKLTGIQDMKPAPLNIVLVLVGSVIMSYVLYHSITFGDAYVHMSGVQGGLMGGFFSWIGFIAPVTLCTKLYEKKPWGLWLLDNGFWLISLLVMGAILGAWM